MAYFGDILIFIATTFALGSLSLYFIAWRSGDTTLEPANAPTCRDSG
jgi:hypothetical protein